MMRLLRPAAAVVASVLLVAGAVLAQGSISNPRPLTASAVVGALGYSPARAGVNNDIVSLEQLETLSTATVVLRGSTSGTTTVQATATASGTLNLPAATDTLVGRATTDTLTNKTISGAANTVTNLPVTSFNDGTGAGPTTFLRGDGTWAAPAGSGTVVAGTTGQVAQYAADGNAVSGVDLTGTGDVVRQTALDALLPSGVVLPYAGSSTPAGFFLCDGSAVSRTTFAALFAAIGTTYGVGDGSTTFNLPDLRGRVPAGKDDMGGTGAGRITAAGSGVDGVTLGAAGGAQTHTLTVAQMPVHAHGGTNGFSFLMANAGIAFATAGAATAAIGYTNNTGNSGGGAAHNNTQPTIILNYIIRQRRRPVNGDRRCMSRRPLRRRAA